MLAGMYLTIKRYATAFDTFEYTGVDIQEKR